MFCMVNTSASRHILPIIFQMTKYAMSTKSKLVMKIAVSLMKTNSQTQKTGFKPQKHRRLYGQTIKGRNVRSIDKINFFRPRSLAKLPKSSLSWPLATLPPKELNIWVIIYCEALQTSTTTCKSSFPFVSAGRVSNVSLFTQMTTKPYVKTQTIQRTVPKRNEFKN